MAGRCLVTLGCLVPAWARNAPQIAAPRQPAPHHGPARPARFRPPASPTPQEPMVVLGFAKGRLVNKPRSKAGEPGEEGHWLMMLHSRRGRKRAAALLVPFRVQAVVTCGLAFRPCDGPEDHYLGTSCLGIPTRAIGAWV